MTNAALVQDARYDEIFSVENETTSRGHAIIEDPYPQFADLRRQGAIHFGSLSKAVADHEMDDLFVHGRKHCTTLTFDTCNKVLIENKLYSSELYHEIPHVLPAIGRTVLSMVGNEHARKRAAMQPMLTRKQAVTWWKDKWIEQLVDMLIGSFVNEGKADLNVQLCARLPMHTVTAAYGLDSTQALELRDHLMRAKSPALTKVEQDRSTTVVREILLSAIRARRIEPRDDLISMMVASRYADDDGQQRAFDDEEIFAFSRLLLLAGGGTTWRQLGITIFALLSDPDQFEAIKADRSLIPNAVQESLRWNCTDPVFFRLSTADSVLNGFEIPAGTIINVCLGAANRDPARWEDPDRYDLHRPVQRHIGFASGPHTCLGRFVAETEMEVALEAICNRLPKLRFDDSAPMPRIIGGLEARGVDHLKVRFD